jgi:hypothetical protein
MIFLLKSKQVLHLRLQEIYGLSVFIINVVKSKNTIFLLIIGAARLAALDFRESAETPQKIFYRTK